MKPSIRIRICNECRNFLLFSDPCHSRMCRNCTVQCGSHRSISWKSLFDGFRVKPSESNAPKISQSAKEQAKIRTEEAVRRFREAKDRGSDSVISAHVPPQSRLQVAKSPRDRLLELLNERKVHRKNPSELPSSDFIFEPIKSGKLTSTERTSSSSNTVAYDRPAFIYPLRSRQQQAINKFLQIAERKRLKREKYPWEEQSVPFDPEKAAEDDMRDLVTQVGTLDSHVLEAARASSILRTSRFYRQLREHHDSFRGKIGLVSDEELSAADRRLYNSLMPRFQMEAQDKPSLQTLWATLQLLTTSTRTGNKIVTPLLKSTLAREGFDPSRGWDLIESPHSTVTHDNFGRIRAPRLMQISRDSATYFNLY